MSIPKNWSDLSKTFIDGTIILWPLIKFQRILGGVGDFWHMGRPIGNLPKPMWIFLRSQYYDL